MLQKKININIKLGNFDSFVYHLIYPLSILFLYFSLFVVFTFSFSSEILAYYKLLCKSEKKNKVNVCNICLFEFHAPFLSKTQVVYPKCYCCTNLILSLFHHKRISKGNEFVIYP